MKAAALHRSPSRGAVISITIIATAVAIGWYVNHRASTFPSTDDATIDADVVHVAATVGGRIVTIPVTENASVSKGDLLFQIDTVPHELTMEQAEADLEIAEAALDTQRRLVATQQSNATIASDQTKRAQTNYDLATRTVERLQPLAAKGFVPEQQLDQAQVSQRDAATSLLQAKEQEAAAFKAIDTIAGQEANVRARKAALAIARRALDDTTVKASTNGSVVGLTVIPGEIVAPSQSLFTLINTDEWFAVANFRETTLHAITIGECATVYSMVDRQQSIKGTVTSIGEGVLDSDKVNLPRSVPYVEPSLNWVRVAQRFPVRIKLVHPPAFLVRVGASAVVEVGYGAQCR
jgi:membrane fusion protein, multidrug efflux system